MAEQCPTCKGDRLHREMVGYHFPHAERCRDLFHSQNHAESENQDEQERAELWRCPECGAAAWHHTRDYPLPGGPALCTHPTPTYERFVLADILTTEQRARREAEERVDDWLERADTCLIGVAGVESDDDDQLANARSMIIVARSLLSDTEGKRDE